MNSPTSPAFFVPEPLLFTFFFALMPASQSCGHLIKALLKAGFGQVVPLIRSIPVFRDSHFSLVVAHGFEGYDITYIRREIWRQANLYRVGLIAVFVCQVVDEFDKLQRRDFPVGPNAVNV